MFNQKEACLNDYLGNNFPCSCGKSHQTLLENIYIAPGAICEIPNILTKLGCRMPMLVCDRNTYRVAGRQAMKILQSGFPGANLCLLDRDDVIPNETTLGELLMKHSPQNDIIIAVGTGTINDLCKFLSFRLRIPYIVVATAPSMDGFASSGAALITNNLKTTYDTHVPLVIIGDVDILCQAPMNMITAGLGDILGKHTCLLDWKIANIINQEYYCFTIVEIVRESIRRVIKSAGKVHSRDPKAITAIMEALVLTGIAMSFVGNSRPASGSEHHLSHYWEMKFLLEGKKPVLHGTKVGVGTVTSCRLYHQLRSFTPDFCAAKNGAASFDMTAWESEIKRTFAQAAPGVIALEYKAHKNSKAEHAVRIAAIEEHWQQIMTAIDETLPDTQKIIEILSMLCAPTFPCQVGIDHETVIDSILVAKEVRDRYTILQLLWDLNVANVFAVETADWFDSLTVATL